MLMFRLFGCNPYGFENPQLTSTVTQPPTTLIPSNHPPLQLVELCILFLQNSGLLELSFFLYTLLLNEANEVLIEIFSFARGFDFS